MNPIQRYSPLTLRSARRFCLLLVTGVLWVGPLAAQQTSQTTLVAPVEITNEHPITNEINIEVMTDSAMIANLNRNLEALRLQIAEQGCDTCGGTATVVRIGQGALVIIAAFIAWQVKKIADKPNGDDNHFEGDTNVEVNVPPHEDHHDHGRRKDHDDSESES